jgi:general secretion pathway protein E
MAGLNIAEKRLPQDGRIRIKLAGKDVDIRVATAPTSFGERITMRLLDKSAVLLDLAAIGMDPNTLTQVESLIHRPHGIMLVTGPTGSGKTTTLYSCLARINEPSLNILTVEDPIEYQLPGISQVAVSPKINLTFASGLRSFLRHDPDVIMVGEIRDQETAEIAIQASLTGHLVFSTLHTNDAAGAFTRLIDMGVEPFLVASSLLASMAQRLVRRLCKVCKEPFVPSDIELAQLGVTREHLDSMGGHLFRPRGCDMCNQTGYKGRAGIYELLHVSNPIRQLVMNRTDAGTIKKLAMDEGMVSLREYGANVVLNGVTSIEEILRLTQVETL